MWEETHAAALQSFSLPRSVKPGPADAQTQATKLELTAIVCFFSVAPGMWAKAHAMEPSCSAENF